MNWTPELLEKFWRGCGAMRGGQGHRDGFRLPDGHLVALKSGYLDPLYNWLNPSSCDLETLLAVLKRLAKERGYASVALVSFVQSEWEHTQVLCAHPSESINVVKDSEKDVVISAICALVGLEASHE